jgi:hypothetical protein
LEAEGYIMSATQSVLKLGPPMLALLMLIGLAFVVAVLVPSAPWPSALPGTDQGVFLYIGTETLSGSIPYRDVWDHKPPAIYYIKRWGCC